MHVALLGGLVVSEVQVTGEKDPVPPVTDQVTVPCGAGDPPGSFTVAVHVAEPFKGMELVPQLIWVVVGRARTVSVVVPLLPVWVVSPASGVYAAPSVCVPPPRPLGT